MGLTPSTAVPAVPLPRRFARGRNAYPTARTLSSELRSIHLL